MKLTITLFFISSLMFTRLLSMDAKSPQPLKMEMKIMKLGNQIDFSECSDNQLKTLQRVTTHSSKIGSLCFTSPSVASMLMGLKIISPSTACLVATGGVFCCLMGVVCSYCERDITEEMDKRRKNI